MDSDEICSFSSDTCRWMRGCVGRKGVSGARAGRARMDMEQQAPASSSHPVLHQPRMNMNSKQQAPSHPTPYHNTPATRAQHSPSHPMLYHTIPHQPRIHAPCARRRGRSARRRACSRRRKCGSSSLYVVMVVAVVGYGGGGCDASVKGGRSGLGLSSSLLLVVVVVMQGFEGKEGQGKEAHTRERARRKTRRTNRANSVTTRVHLKQARAKAGEARTGDTAAVARLDVGLLLLLAVAAGGAPSHLDGTEKG